MLAGNLIFLVFSVMTVLSGPVRHKRKILLQIIPHCMKCQELIKSVTCIIILDMDLEERFPYLVYIIKLTYFPVHDETILAD